MFLFMVMVLSRTRYVWLDLVLSRLFTNASDVCCLTRLSHTCLIWNRSHGLYGGCGHFSGRGGVHVMCYAACIGAARMRVL